MLQKQVTPGRVRVTADDLDYYLDDKAAAAYESSQTQQKQIMPGRARVTADDPGYYLDDGNAATAFDPSQTWTADLLAGAAGRAPFPAVPTANGSSAKAEPSSGPKPMMGWLQYSVELSLGFCVTFLGAAHCRGIESLPREAPLAMDSSLVQVVILLAVLIAAALAFLALVAPWRHDPEHARQQVPPPVPGAGLRNDSLLHLGNCAKPVRGGSVQHLAVHRFSFPPTGDVVAPPLIPAAAPQQPGGSSTEGQPSARFDCYLCPDLVVPPERECTVAVPVTAAPRGVFNVTDTDGNPMFQLASDTGSRTDAGSTYPDLNEFVLMHDHASVLARCSSELTGGAFSISKPSGTRFAQIAFRGDGNFPGNTDGATRHCLLTTGRGKQLYFSGDPVHHLMKANDAAGNVVADTALCNMDLVSSPAQYYRLRVSATHDVGLVICSLFATRAMFATSGA